MKKLMQLFVLLATAMLLCVACGEEQRNTEALIDPWLRERTPVNFRLESQIGAAVITGDWRHDDQGSIMVSLITGGLDLTKVRVEALDFKFPDSEYCPTASIGKGSTLDLSSGKASFTVTAHNGETREYTVTYEQFKDPLEGVYTFDKIAGILDGGAPQSAMILIGGWTDAIVLSTAMDKSWQWGDGYNPGDEEDNTLSFMLTEADSETGETFGTLVNTAGEDGKWANYMYQNKRDVNPWYRIFPAGSSRWSKDGSGNITVYDKDDTHYENPLWTVIPLDGGTYTISTKDVTIPSYAFMRDFDLQPSEEVIDWNWPDSRWMADNIRNTFWFVRKTSDSPLPEHDSLF